jgi:uncharacterized cupin superfamily protein
MSVRIQKMADSIFVTAANENAPICANWILSGTSEAHSTMLAKSQDGTPCIIAWECTVGEFVWHYPEDETVVVISGEAFITNGASDECRLAEGQVAFFPGGSSSRWRVTRPIKKIVVLRRDLPRPFGFAVRAWHLLLQVSGLRAGASLMPRAGAVSKARARNLGIRRISI